MSGRTVEQAVGDWYAAFTAIRAELTSEDTFNTLAAMKGGEGMEGMHAYVSLASQVMANERTAATVAASITQTGIRRLVVDEPEEGQ